MEYLDKIIDFFHNSTFFIIVSIMIVLGTVSFIDELFRLFNSELKLGEYVGSFWLLYSFCLMGHGFTILGLTIILLNWLHSYFKPVYHRFYIDKIDSLICLSIYGYTGYLYYHWMYLKILTSI